MKSNSLKNSFPTPHPMCIFTHPCHLYKQLAAERIASWWYGISRVYKSEEYGAGTCISSLFGISRSSFPVVIYFYFSIQPSPFLAVVLFPATISLSCRHARFSHCCSHLFVISHPIVTSHPIFSSAHGPALSSPSRIIDHMFYSSSRNGKIEVPL